MPLHAPGSNLSMSTRTSNLIPKDATRVSHLTRANAVDGTGITVAILDTGVDPGAPGLSLTSSNHRKLVDVVDCTSSGDVITTTAVTLPQSRNDFEALSGRILTIPQRIFELNPSRKFKLGIKNAYELFPTTLVARLKKERRVAWDKHVRTALNAVRKRIYHLREQSPTHTIIPELEARQAVLLSVDKAYFDYGPQYDVLVFHDGTRWRVVVDTSECGDLLQCDILEDYAVHTHYSQFSAGIMMNFAVNIYNDGDLISIVVDGSHHGTHVAGILASNFPEEPHLNGLAPGASIVSLKIGDSRLSSMETHQGYIRALNYVLNHSLPTQNKAHHNQYAYASEKDPMSASHSQSPIASRDFDLQSEPVRESSKESHRIRIDACNMSFGEHSRDGNRGRFIALVEKLVYKHNVMFISSAGNDGPGLSSVSAPGGTTDAIIGVGAYVTPAMLTEAYSLLHSEFGDYGSALDSVESETELEKDFTTKSSSTRDPVVAFPYTWSSRGLAWDGGMGVSICSPGGAIASVPLWMLRKKMLLNGTSMSSPSAAGAIAVILSFLKKEGIPYTSSLVRRAIENTARPLKSPTYSMDTMANRAASSQNIDHSSKFDSEYYLDVVFAAGHGSVDALAACRYIEAYMAPRKILGDADIPSNVQHRSRAAEAVATSLLEVSDSAIETHSDKKNLNDSMAEKPDLYYTTYENCGDSSLFLEDWRLKITIYDGTPSSRKPSSASGFGALNTTRGIYIRGEAQSSMIHRASVNIEIVPHDKDCLESRRALADMEVTISLSCAASWVEVPSTLVMWGSDRSFFVCIDPTQLAPGLAHFAELVGHVVQKDKKAPGGPVLRVPIAVLKPEPLVDGVMIKPLRKLQFAPGSVVRRFFDAPYGATYGILRITTGKLSRADRAQETLKPKERESSSVIHPNEVVTAVDFSELSSTPSQTEEAVVSSFTLLNRSRIDTPAEARSDSNTKKIDNSEREKGHESRSSGRAVNLPSKETADLRCFDVHIVQLGPRMHCGELETRQLCNLRSGTVKELTIRVKGGCTLELCIAQLWSSPGRSVIENVELVFGGVLPNPTSLHSSTGASCFPHVEVSNFLGSIMPSKRASGFVSGYSPRASLAKLQRIVTPFASKIQALRGRDAMPEDDIMFQLRLDYKFEVFESTSTASITFPGFNNAVYEAEIEGGPYVTVHDWNKEFLFASDIYPREESLRRGEYTASAHLRHDKVDVLEGLRGLNMTVQYGLPEIIHLDAYDSAHGACLGLDSRRSARNTSSLECGERRAFYFSAPKRSAFPKWATVGDVAIGQMQVDKVLSASNSSIRRNYVPSYPVSFLIGTCTSPSKNEDKSSSEKDKESEGSKSMKRSKSENNSLSEGKENDENTDKLNEEGSKWFEDAVRKLRLKRLRHLLKHDDFQKFDILCKSVQEQYSESIEFLMANLERQDVEALRIHRTEGVTNNFRDKVKYIVELADEGIRKLDPTAVAAHFGVMTDTENSEEENLRKAFETKRTNLVEILFRKARIVCLVAMSYGLSIAERDMSTTSQKMAGEIEENHHLSEHEKNAKEAGEASARAFKEFLRWNTLDGKGYMPGSSKKELCDGSTTSEDLALLGARRELRRGKPGTALRVLSNYYSGGSSKKKEAKCVINFREDLYRRLGWTYFADRERSYARVRYPKQFAPA